MLMFGDQKVRPRKRARSPRRCASWYLARASVEMTSATRPTSRGLKVAPKPIACGKTVATPLKATPCSASFHQSYSGTPRRWMAGAAFIICETFSSSVIRETRSATRRSKGRLGSRYGAPPSGLCPCAATGEALRRRQSANASAREILWERLQDMSVISPRRLAATRPKTEMLTEERHHVILEAVGHLARMGALVHLEA